MATLMLTDAGELTLLLHGADENVILTTLRRWPNWQRAEIEHDPVNPQRTVSVKLVADRVHEDTVRFILERSFGLRFPPTGGSSVFTPLPVKEKGQRKRR